jgi:hypothetical protein
LCAAQLETQQAEQQKPNLRQSDGRPFHGVHGGVSLGRKKVFSNCAKLPQALSVFNRVNRNFVAFALRLCSTPLLINLEMAIT